MIISNKETYGEDIRVLRKYTISYYLESFEDSQDHLGLPIQLSLYPYRKLEKELLLDELFCFEK